MRLSKEAREKQPAIQMLCHETTDDVLIAKLFHIPLYEVQEIREMPLPEPEPEPKDDQAAKSSEIVVRTHAEMGSQRLREAIERMFERFEIKHRLAKGEGLVVNQYGWGTLERLREREQPIIGKAA